VTTAQAPEHPDRTPTAHPPTNRPPLPDRPPTYRPPLPDRADLHLLLLALAGRVNDRALAEMRMCLADREHGTLASLLAAEARTGGLTLTGREVTLLRALFTACGDDPAPAIRAPRCATPAEATDHRFGTSAGRGRDGASEVMDAVVTEAGVRVGGLVGIWRVFRASQDRGARRVYLAEAKEGAALTELAAEIQYALNTASEDIPRVEVFPEGAGLPPYHEAALTNATLVWTEQAAVRLARAFDGADADGPFFHPGHPRLDGPDGERVLAYLRSGELVLNPPGALDDVLDPGRAGTVPLGFRSDGRWVWPDAAAYYLKSHRLAPEPDLIAHVLDAQPPQPPQPPRPPRPLNRTSRHQVLTALFAPTEGEPVWQAG
jgi:hypothetical protein